MLDAIGQASLHIIDPVHLLMLLAGTLLGLTLGVIPGIGGVTGLALLSPQCSSRCLARWGPKPRSSTATPWQSVARPGVPSAPPSPSLR